MMKFYRYDFHRTGSSIDSEYYGEHNKLLSILPNINVSLHIYESYKETPKGYWIKWEGHLSPDYFKKWIPKESKKRYAYPTKKEAINNFIKRNEFRLTILESQICDIEIALKKANKIKEELNIVNHE